GIVAGPRVITWARARSPWLATGLAVAWCALACALVGWVGLSPLVGAFVAGLALAPAAAATEVAHRLRPAARMLVPLFFVTLGMQADLTALGGHRALVAVLVCVLTLVAILAKLASGLGVV